MPILMFLLQLDPDAIQPDITDRLAPHWAKDFAIWFVGACVIGSLVARVLPPPSLFPWEKGRSYYLFFYTIVQGLNCYPFRKNWDKEGGS